MNAPPRLLEDPEVAEALKKDLQCAVEHKLDFDVAANLARFEASLAGGAAAGAATQGALLKWLVVGVAGAGIAATLYLSSEGKSPETSPRPTSTSVAPEAAPTVASEPEQKEHDAAPEIIRAEELEVEKAPQKPIKMAKEPSQAPPAESVEEPESKNDLLEREVAHLRSVRRALSTNPGQALALANAGHAEFKGGVLYQEREALALQALNALGRKSELEARGARYLAAFPSGSFSDQVRGMLKR